MEKTVYSVLRGSRSGGLARIHRTMTITRMTVSWERCVLKGRVERLGLRASRVMNRVSVSTANVKIMSVRRSASKRSAELSAFL